MKRSAWGEVSIGEPTRTPTRSWTAISAKYRTHSSMCVGFVTICLQPDDDAKLSAAVSCTVVVEDPSHSSGWAFSSPTNKTDAFLSADCTLAIAVNKQLKILSDKSGSRLKFYLINQDCYYKSGQLWIHNIHTHKLTVYMKKLSLV